MKRILILSLFLCISCTTTIKCDQKNNAMVALMDHGRHATLVIHIDGINYRYGYGDWEFYAKGRSTFWNGTKALLWPTKAGLGRKEISGPFEKSFLMDSVPDWTEEVLFLKGNIEQVSSLKSRLDNIYFSNIKNKSLNQDYELDFVPYPDNYWVFNNSNQVMGEWVEEVGCESKGMAMLSRWKLKNN